MPLDIRFGDVRNRKSARGLIWTRRNEGTEMAETATYKIVGSSGNWHIEVDGERQGDWETKEAAYEAAIAAGSNAIKKGLAVVITVPGPAPGESAVG